MTNAELEEVICGLHRRIALTTAGTPLQDDLIKAVGALRIAVNRIAELEAQVEALKEESEAYKFGYLDGKTESDRQIEDLQTALTACRLRKDEAQMPKEGECEAKKPKTVKETEWSFYCDCPTCGGRLISNVDGEWCAGSFDRLCRMCGQKIDWSEYCGKENRNE